jgi:hypothetical protein
MIGAQICFSRHRAVRSGSCILQPRAYHYHVRTAPVSSPKESKVLSLLNLAWDIITVPRWENPQAAVPHSSYIST